MTQFPTHRNREFNSALQGIESGHQGIFSPDQGIRRSPRHFNCDVKRVVRTLGGTMITGSASSPTRPNACLMFGSADPVKPEVRVTPREQAAGHRRPRATRRSAPRCWARRSALRSGSARGSSAGPRRAAVPRRTAEQRTADAAAGSMNKLVQVQCARRIAGCQLRRSRRSARRSRS